MRRIIESVSVGIFLIIISKALEEYGPIDIMKSIYQHFIIELWPMWIGLIAAFLYWIIRDYIQLKRFNNDLKKWIGLFSYGDKYSDLKGKIKLYIKEEIEKEGQPENSAD